MGFLHKTRDPAVKDKLGKKASTVSTTLENETVNNINNHNGKKAKTLLGGIFNKNSNSTTITYSQQPQYQQPPPPYSPVDTHKPPVITTTLPPTTTSNPIVAQIPVLNNQPKLQTTTPTTPTTATAPSPLGADWHISDLVFLVEGKRITSHKVVLVSRCAYFARLLRDTPPGSVTTIEIGEFSHHIFSRFVRLVYGGKKDNIAPEDSAELVRCALQYEAPDIANTCQEVLAEYNERLRAQQELEEQEMLFRQQQEYEQQQQQQMQYMQQQQQLQHEYEQQQQQQFQQQLSYEIEMAAANSNFVTADQSLTAFDSLGMNIWSNDPILYNANPETFEQNEGYRIMEIC